MRVGTVASTHRRRGATVDTAPPTAPSPRVDAALEIAAVAGRSAATHGRVADYIPALADVDPNCFGAAISQVDGGEHGTGDVEVPFAIQSISKIFALTLAMQRVGTEQLVGSRLWQRVGREPSGDPFNSLVQLEHERGIPRNPLINAGALVVSDVLLAHCDDARASMLELLSELAGEPVGIDEEIERSEADTSHRNRAMANLIASFGNLHHSVDEVLDAYVHHCSVEMTSRQLARAVRFLANDGIDPGSGRRVLSAALARRVTAIMLTCGTYDAAGEFAFCVGLPCKSGVGGGIVAVAPDQMGLCAWSPPLDDTGNSLGARIALEHLAEDLELSIF
jgi:glutaminase